MLAKQRAYNESRREYLQGYMRKYNKEYKIKNKERLLELSKLEYEKNKERYKIRAKKWRAVNKARRAAHEKKRRVVDPLFKITNNVRSRIGKVLAGLNKSKKSFGMIGCTAAELKQHLEKQFTEGMSWYNYGSGWHIDHIIPLSSGKTVKEIEALCHHTNLQPLWARDNLSKGKKLAWQK